MSGVTGQPVVGYDGNKEVSDDENATHRCEEPANCGNLRQRVIPSRLIVIRIATENCACDSCCVGPASLTRARF